VAALGVILVFVGLAALIVGLVALIRGHLDWARIGNRKFATVPIVGALVVIIWGGLLLPSKPVQNTASTPTSITAAPVTTTATPPASTTTDKPTVRSTTAPTTTTTTPATSTQAPPPTVTTTPSATPAPQPPAVVSDSTHCRLLAGGGTVYVSITSAVAHNFSACAGGTQVSDDSFLALLSGDAPFDRRCVSSSDNARQDQAIIGVYSSAKDANLAAARTFCTGQGITEN